MFGPGWLFVVADVIAVLVRQAAAAAANDAAHGDLDLSILSPNLPIAPPTTAPAPAPATATAGGVGLGLAATSYTPVRPNLLLLSKLSRTNLESLLAASDLRC